LERPERILLLFLGAALPPVMPAVLWILAIFTNVTVIQRVLYTRRHLAKNGMAGKEEPDRRNS
jgi:hypothetical protein